MRGAARQAGLWRGRTEIAKPISVARVGKPPATELQRGTHVSSGL